MPGIKGLRERLQDGEAVICAEGYMWELERRGYLRCGDFTPEVVLDYPERVVSLHEEFVSAGSDVVEAFTYYGHREKLKSIGRENDLENLNLSSLRMARQVADKTGTLMAGNVCNTTVYDPNDPASAEKVKAMFKEQVEWAVKGGADYMIGETFNDLGEAKLALEAIRTHGQGLPAVICLAIYSPDKTTDDVQAVQALRELELAGADVVGFNCARGPDTMLPLLREARAICKGPLAALPVPFRTTPEEVTFQSLTDSVTGKALYPLDLACRQCSRTDIRKFAEEACGLGIQYIGLCCGASSSLVREVAEAYGRKPPSSIYSPDVSRNLAVGKNVSKHVRKVRDYMFGHLESYKV